MVKQYEVGDKAALTITWLDQTGVQATVTGTPTITIKSYNATTDTWTTEVNAANLTSESGSTWFYEYDTTGQTANEDYKVFYNATVDGLSVESTEEFRLTEAADLSGAATSAELTSAKNEILTQVKELRHGNEQIEFTYSGSQLTSMSVKTKADTASDWSSPTSTKTIYFTYTAGVLTKVGSA